MDKSKNRKPSQHAAGDELFKNCPEHVRNLHNNYKKTKRAADRSDFKQRMVDRQQFE